MSAAQHLTALARPKSLHHQGAPTYELVARPDGAFHLKAPESGLMRAADGTFNFVRIQGALRGHTPMFVSARTGHAALAQGQPVLYAGTLSIRQGQLAWWSNYSGTYLPSPHFRSQAKLPQDKFVPWQKLQMGGVGLQRGMLSDHRPAGAPERRTAAASKPVPPGGAAGAKPVAAKPASASPVKPPGRQAPLAASSIRTDGKVAIK